MKIKVKWFNPSPDKPNVFEVNKNLKEFISDLEKQYNDKILIFNLV